MPKHIHSMVFDVGADRRACPENKCEHRLTALVFVLLLLLILAGCERKSPPEKSAEEAQPAALKPEEKKHVEINLKETKLSTVPEDYDRVGFISFSADGRQVFYRARKKGENFVVSNDKAGTFYEAIKDLIVYSPDGKKVAYDGKRGMKEYLVIDDKEVASYDDVAPGAFSPDGNLLACEVQDKKKKKWFIVVFDREKEVYRSQAYPLTFRRPAFSPDGRVLVYELGEKDKKRIVFFLDLSARKIIKERLYDDPGIAGKFSFSSHFSRIVYEAGKGGRFFLVFQDFALNEERTINLPYIQTGTIVLSPDGRKIVYIATKGGKHYIVVSPWESPARGKEKGPYEAIIPPIFDPGSTTVAYHALKEGKWRNVVGDKEGAAKYDGIDAPVFSPDGAKIAYTARRGGHQDRMGVIGGKWFMVVSPTSKPAVVKEGSAYDMVVTPVFSPDGRRIAYRARKGPMENAKRFIVIADAETGKVIKQGPAGDEIWPPVFSSDGKSVGYGARIGRELWWKVQTLP